MNNPGPDACETTQNEAKQQNSDLDKIVERSSEINRNFFVVYLGLLIYIQAIVFSTSDRQLLFYTEGLTLPIIDLTIPLIGFYVVVPLFIIVLHFNLLQNLESHHYKLMRWQDQAPGGKVLRSSIQPFLFDFAELEHEGQLKCWVGWANSLLCYSLAPMTLGFVLVRLSHIQNPQVTLWHYLTFIFDAWLVWKLRLAMDDNKYPQDPPKIASIWLFFSDITCYGLRGIFGFFLLIETLLTIAIGGTSDKYFVENVQLNLLPSWHFQSVLAEHARWFLPRIVIDPSEAVWKDDKDLLDTEAKLAGSNDADKYFNDDEGKNFNERRKGFLPDTKSLRLASLRGQNLPNAQLKGFRLQGADLSEAQLQGADLSNAQLQWANLSKVQLQGAKLSEVRLWRANLSEAQLQEADLSEARLNHADFSYAQLHEADLSKATLDHADFSNAQLHKANLSFTELIGANLYNAKLQKADLSHVEMQETNLEYAQLEGANLSFSELRWVQFTGAQLQGANLSYTKLQGDDISHSQLQLANFSGAQLQGADLAYAQLQGADLAYAQLQGTDLSYAQLQGANLSNAQLQGADLSHAQLQGVSLYKTGIVGIKNLDSKPVAVFGLDKSDTMFDETEPDWAGLEVKAEELLAPMSPDDYLDRIREARKNPSVDAKKFWINQPLAIANKVLPDICPTGWESTTAFRSGINNLYAFYHKLVPTKDYRDLVKDIDTKLCTLQACILLRNKIEGLDCKAK